MRTFLMVSALALVSGCGDGNPFFDVEGDPDPDTTAIYASEFDSDLTMNNLDYNEGDDTLSVNNLPFDGPDGTYDHGADLGNGFDSYENAYDAETAPRRYFAVFRRSTYAQVAAVGTGDYAGFGFGGAMAQRLGVSNVDLPNAGTYEYTGSYAGVRVYDLGGGSNDVNLVTGDATLNVDITDFDVTGAVEGTISNRFLYANDGTLIGALDEFISLSTAGIDFNNDVTLASTATGYVFVDSAYEPLLDGSWTSLFTGPDGEEIAGIIVIEGDLPGTPDDIPTREVGVFIVFD